MKTNTPATYRGRIPCFLVSLGVVGMHGEMVPKAIVILGGEQVNLYGVEVNDLTF